MLHIEFWSLWLLLGFGFILAEIFLSGFSMVSLAISSFAAAIAGALHGPIWAQAFVFGLFTTLTLAWLRPYALKYEEKTTTQLRLGVMGLIGKYGIVSEEIDPKTGQGKVLIGEGLWTFQLKTKAPVQLGDSVRVLSMDGSLLKVEPYDLFEV